MQYIIIIIYFTKIMVAVYKENNKLGKNDDSMQDKWDKNEEYKPN